MESALRPSRAALAALCCVLLVLCAENASAQVELLGLDHPITSTLVRLQEYGAIPGFAREHLPISRSKARLLLETAASDTALPFPLRDQAQYDLVELNADTDPSARALLIPASSSDHSFYREPFGSRPLALAQWSDDSAGVRVVLEPVLDGDLRTDLKDGGSALIGQGGAQLRGSVLDRIGFAARVTNGSVAGDSAVAARDPRIARAGAFGIAGFGRDIDYATGHLRADWDVFALEIAREPVQLGGGLDRSLLLASALPSTYDYLRLSLNIGPGSYTHVHGSILPDIDKGIRGAGATIPTRYVAAHLLTVRFSDWLRISLGESVIYSNRPFEIGYLNPFAFLRSQEHTYRDRDNANMYAAVGVNPIRGLYAEGEFMLDDLKFSRIGDGFWSNKNAWRVAVSSRAILGTLDLGLSYTRLEPYIYTHFSGTNIYSHDAGPLAGGGLPPNSHLVQLSAEYHPLPNLSLRAWYGTGEHGANVMDADTLLQNVGGDVRFTYRLGIDSETVEFLDGVLEKIERARVEFEYEPLRNVYIRLTAISDLIGGEVLREGRIGVRVGAR